MEGSVAIFALPNAAHRDAAEERRGQVEQELSSHFGTPLTLRLTVDDSPGSLGSSGPAGAPAGTPAVGRARPGAASPRPGAIAAGADEPRDDEPEVGLDPGDEIDPDQPSGSAEFAAQARLLQAFPGAEEVE
jgi:hypothetical protein